MRQLIIVDRIAPIIGVPFQTKELAAQGRRLLVACKVGFTLPSRSHLVSITKLVLLRVGPVLY